jgi:diguanylate cyclase (GGDEF)-like protein
MLAARRRTGSWHPGCTPKAPMPKRSRSPFSERLNALTERWAALLPVSMRAAFQDELRAFGAEYDDTLDTIEDIWRRRERDYAIDETTGLARRRPFLDYLVGLLETPESPLVGAIAVLFIDVDHLKRINDTYGHQAGDRAVAAAGAIIRETIRVDRSIAFMSRTRTGAEYSVSRHGGDEFLVALELRSPADVHVVSARLKQSLDDPRKQRAQGYDVPTALTVSLGGIVYPLTSAPVPFPPHLLARSLITAADQQMYKAKQDGRIHLATARFSDRLDIENEDAPVLS